ncbi:MAG TPA: hypothetical protein EYG16_01975 [Deltaproteobacteria bacterium]|nr:hypothetical protein [Candidatus Binatota bacterium]HIL12422.1 hypothetical protein [Deltaproteobacteria bacterium]
MSSKWTGVAAAAIAALVLALGVPTADAQITKDEAKCRGTIGKNVTKYVATAWKAVGGCHKSRDKGKVGAGTDCNDLGQADIKGKLTKAAAKLRSSIGGAKDKCADKTTGNPFTNVLDQYGRCPSPAQATDDGGAGDGIDDFAELSDCLIGLADATVEMASKEINGLPDNPTGLSKDQLKCRGAIAKNAGKLVATVGKERSKCQAGTDKSLGPISWVCGSADPKGKIASTAGKTNDGIAKACALSKAELDAIDSCGDTVAQLQACVTADVAITNGGGTVAMAFELPGNCPASFPVLFNAGYGAQLTNSELDSGFNGGAHDVDIVDAFQSAVLTACDGDCANCVVTEDPSPGYCRCDNDLTTTCDEPFVADADDCGGDTCNCFFGPPLALSSSGTPVCVINEITGPLDCNCDGITGECTGDCKIGLTSRLHQGIGQTKPCPTCEGGTCSGGPRDGLACTVDATHPDFGPGAIECPPDAGSKISDLSIALNLNHGVASLPFGTQCDAPLAASSCACAVCSGDSTVGCNSDAECTALGAGTCDSNGGGAGRLPNGCAADGVCGVDPDDPSGQEGICTNAANVVTFCDAQLRASGKGLIPCSSDADCDVLDSECDGGDCGDCTLVQGRDCYLDPIEAAGDPSPYGGDMGAIFCVPPTASPAVNNAGGLPGAGRVTINFDYHGICDDGVTAFEAPGGSNCP